MEFTVANNLAFSVSFDFRFSACQRFFCPIHKIQAHFSVLSYFIFKEDVYEDFCEYFKKNSQN